MHEVTRPQALFTKEQREAFTAQVKAGDMGPERPAIGDRAFPEMAHVHTRRAGKPKTDLASVRLATCSPLGIVTVTLTPALARQLAASLLDDADEADGTAPLMFSPRDVEPENLDTPGTDK